MSKKYYWKMNGYLYEVSKEQYYEYRREQNRHDYLKKQKQEAVILSLDALGADGMSGESFIADTQINVEEETIHNIMLEKLRGALDKFSAEELLLIDLLYSQTKSERETASILGISQNAVNKKKHKLLGRLKKSFIKLVKNGCQSIKKVLYILKRGGNIASHCSLTTKYPITNTLAITGAMLQVRQDCLWRESLHKTDCRI